MGRKTTGKVNRLNPDRLEAFSTDSDQFRADGWPPPVKRWPRREPEPRPAQWRIDFWRKQYLEHQKRESEKDGNSEASQG